MVQLAKNYHYIDFSEPKKNIYFLFFLAGPVAGRPALGPGSQAGPGIIEKPARQPDQHRARVAGDPAPGSGISVTRILLTNGNPFKGPLDRSRNKSQGAGVPPLTASTKNGIWRERRTWTHYGVGADGDALQVQESVLDRVAVQDGLALHHGAVPDRDQVGLTEFGAREERTSAD